MVQDSKNPHFSVMLPEILQYLNLQDDGIYLDCTFGAGGYTKAILEAGGNCKVIACDRDVQTKKYADTLEQKYGKRFEYRNIDFASIATELAHYHGQLAGVVYDLGVSSMQLDEAERGFSFDKEADLDMRMDNSKGVSAADIVNSYDEKSLADLIYKYGDERKSRLIAKAIVKARQVEPITKTTQLRDIICGVVGFYKDQINPATRTFQAIRIEVNNELSQIEDSLVAASELLRPGGRLVVVSFHSGEDRIVKNIFADLCGKKKEVVGWYNRYIPAPPEVEGKAAQPKFIKVTRKVVEPSSDEVRQNIRSRSAKLRAIEKLSENLTRGDV